MEDIMEGVGDGHVGTEKGIFFGGATNFTFR